MKHIGHQNQRHYYHYNYAHCCEVSSEVSVSDGLPVLQSAEVTAAAHRHCVEQILPK